MEIKGKIIAVSDIETFNSGFYKRTVVVDNGEKWENPLPLEMVKEKADLFSGKVGETGTFFINLRGREYNGRYFVNVQCWKWELDQPAQPTQEPQETARETDNGFESDDEGEVPF